MSSLNCTGIDPNPDISGVGVRTAIYAQAFLRLIQPIIASLDGHISEEELSNLHLLYIGILLPGCALLSAVIQAAQYGFTAYHAIIVLYSDNLSTLSTEDDLGSLEWKENAQSLAKRIDQPRFAKPLEIDVDRGWWLVVERKVRYIPGAREVVDLLERDMTMACLSSGHLIFVSAFGVWFWFTLNRSVTSQPLRVASIIIYLLGLILFINLLFWGAFQFVIVYLISIARKSLSRTPSDATPVPRTAKELLGSSGRTVLYSFIGLVDCEAAKRTSNAESCPRTCM
ncbi:hypothetical protein FA15DRAFT_729806 [Coprinopsis marcescibilis]|uniref:Uncharacterized protein n=1 Tax=Coprinopsis marcescibilis TaxID=230819 RepID=A0A5C3KED2_COPMA|nr:hypothetical protein FA15DRAFT_729806 [Coprinopsis marcescibilis]